MQFPSKEQVARQRRLYPAGTRVELVQMDDAQAPPIGTRGTVIGVDDTGSIMVRWDNGSQYHLRCRSLPKGSDQRLKCTVFFTNICVLYVSN